VVPPTSKKFLKTVAGASYAAPRTVLSPVARCSKYINIKTLDENKKYSMLLFIKSAKGPSGPNNVQVKKKANKSVT